MIIQDLPIDIEYRGNFELGQSASISSIRPRVLRAEDFRDNIHKMVEEVIESAKEVSPDGNPFIAYSDNFLSGYSVSFYSKKTEDEMRLTEEKVRRVEEANKLARYEQFLELSKEFGQVDLSKAPQEDNTFTKQDQSNVMEEMAQALSDYGIDLMDLMGN